MGLLLEELKDRIQNVCLSHKQVNNFDYGEQFDVATNNRLADYPLVFLEIPYFLIYEPNRRFKTNRFALIVVAPSNFDENIKSHEVISRMEEIGDAILTKLEAEFSDLKFDNIDGVSLRDFSDDNLAGVRYEVTVRTQRLYCSKPTSYKDEFE